MNYYTMIIADLLKVSKDTAYEIQKELEMTDFDFSEASDIKIKREAKLILKGMNL